MLCAIFQLDSPYFTNGTGSFFPLCTKPKLNYRTLAHSEFSNGVRAYNIIFGKRHGQISSLLPWVLEVWQASERT